MPVNYQIASEQEWDEALNIIKNNKKNAFCFKLNLKDNPKLYHSFLYLSNPNKSKIVAIARHHYLGEGSFGRVKIVEDQDRNLYVLKIQKHPIEENEKKCLEKMGYLEFNDSSSKHGKKHYLLQKYFAGITLEEYLELNPQMSLTEKKGLLCLLIQALQELHEKNIVHGDLKPNNFIILNGKNNQVQIKAIDFGGAYILKDGTKFIHVKCPIGALEYRAPEAGKDQIYCVAKLSKNSDIYSLGVLAKEDLKLNLPCVKEMCARVPEQRISLNNALNALKNFEAPPLVERKDRLNYIYQKELMHIINYVKKRIQSQNKWANIVNNESFNLAFKDGINIEQNPLPFRPFDKIVEKKYSHYPLNELLAKSNIPMKNIKDCLLDALQKIVRLTNNIETLKIFFDHLKQSEYCQPILSSEQGFFMKIFGDTGLTSSWQKALNIFKERALELAQNEVNLKKIISNKEKYIAIFQEKGARVFEFKVNHLKKYEELTDQTDVQFKA